MPDPHAEVQRLQHRVAELEEAFGLKLQFPPDLGLSSFEARCCGLLLKRQLVSREQFLIALYADSDSRDERTVDAHIHKLRRKLARDGIAIRTHWGQGWSFTAENRKKLNALIARLNYEAGA